jgi:hypothetical protein
VTGGRVAISKFMESLTALGFATYGDYLAGEHWKQFKASYRASGLSMECAVCCGKPIQLHHHDYSRLGKEKLEDVTPLCREHHEGVHAWLKEHKKGNVAATHKAVAALRGDKVAKPPKRSKPQKKGKQDRKAPRVQGYPAPTPEVIKLGAILFELQVKTGKVSRDKCENVVLHCDVRSIKVLIRKMGGPDMGISVPKRKLRANPPKSKKYRSNQPHPDKDKAAASMKEHKERQARLFNSDAALRRFQRLLRP